MLAHCSSTVDSLVVPLDVAWPAKPLGAPHPLSAGVPVPKGYLFEVGTGVLRGPGGWSTPAQLECQARWSDGSVRWLLADWILPPGLRPHGGLELHVGGDGAEIQEGIELDERAEGWAVETGAARFHFDRRRFLVASCVELAEQRLKCPIEIRAAFTDRRGRTCEPKPVALRVETSGPIRTTVCAEGSVGGLRLYARTSFFAGSARLRVELTAHNPRRARHRGALWDLGDPGSILFRDLSLVAQLTGPLVVYWKLHPDDGPNQTALSGSEMWRLYQDSSGGANWASVNHVNRHGKVPCRMRGFRLDYPGTSDTGLRALPAVAAAGPGAAISAAVPEFWQQFPKSLEVGAGQVRIGLFPRHWGDLHELQGGEQKTHEVWLEMAAEAGEGAPGDLDGCHRGAVATPSPGWCDACAMQPRLDLRPSEPLERLDSLLEEFLDGPSSVFAHRERVDEFGWRHFGEIFADHEQEHYSGSEPLMSHFNNQYDMVRGFLLHYLRTFDRRLWELADALARHVIDIDIYHTEGDRSAYNGGLFWHTDHYVHAHTATHRTYARKNRAAVKGPYGGGPNAQHNYTTGLLLYSWLTGCPRARQAVIGLADWVMHMDDGRATILGLVDPAPTGTASATADPHYHGPGRGAGNSVNALLDAFALTADGRYLAYAETLIRRCIHPADCVKARHLLDLENRWSYTVFLTSLAKYLAVKEELDELDAMFAYGRESLLHYGRWMCRHERPYFDQREKLVFPTETWAAQEFRKANVLRRAARYAEPPLRDRMMERGEALADRAWSDLMGFATRTTARAVAIVMVEGLVDCEFRTLDRETAVVSAQASDFGRPQEFIPQKERVRRMVCSPRQWPQLVWAAVAGARRKGDLSGNDAALRQRGTSPGA